MLTPNPISIVMMAMSPLLMIGAWVDQVVTGKRMLKQQSKDFAEAMLKLQDELTQEREVERRVRVAEAPSLAQVRGGHRRAGAVAVDGSSRVGHLPAASLGVGAATSRNEIELPSSNDTMPEFWDQLEQLQAEFT